MKRFFTLLLMLGMIAFSGTTYELMAQDGTDSTATEAVTETTTPVANSTADDEVAEDEPIDEVLKRRFIEGGWDFMSLPLICLILGLAFAIERILTLNLSTVNTGKLLKKVEGALSEGDVDRAKEICRSTRGPVASVFYQGLDRANEGLDVVERSIVSYGSVQMGRLQKGLVWIALFIALAPMLGFMGTVIGMIDAFDSIEKAGDISPGVVARGIKIALLTTVFGLIVAIILQIFYNYITSKVDSLVNNMEDASISLVDLMSKYNVSPK